MEIDGEFITTDSSSTCTGSALCSMSKSTARRTETSRSGSKVALRRRTRSTIDLALALEPTHDLSPGKNLMDIVATWLSVA
jgi:hypothetical protein